MRHQLTVNIHLVNGDDIAKFNATVEQEGLILAVDGDTIEEIEQNLLNAISDTKEALKEIPTTLQVEEYSFEYKFDIDSLLAIYKGIFNKSSLAKIAGINPSAFRRTLSSEESKVSKKQLKQIEAGLHELGEKLKAIKLV